MHVIQDYDTPVSNYVRMWLKKISHRKFAKRTHTTMGMVQALYMCHHKVSLQTVAKFEYHLDCHFDVIIGRQPCLAKCQHCEISQP